MSKLTRRATVYDDLYEVSFTQYTIDDFEVSRVPYKPEVDSPSREASVVYTMTLRDDRVAELERNLPAGEYEALTTVRHYQSRSNVSGRARVEVKYSFSGKRTDASRLAAIDAAYDVAVATDASLLLEKEVESVSKAVERAVENTNEQVDRNHKFLLRDEKGKVKALVDSSDPTLLDATTEYEILKGKLDGLERMIHARRNAGFMDAFKKYIELGSWDEAPASYDAFKKATEKEQAFVESGLFGRRRII